MIVGAFPTPDKLIYGGVVTSCETLLQAGIGNWFDLVLLDSTQRSVPAPTLVVRTMDALLRIVKCFYLLVAQRPHALLIFASTGLSFVEKSLLAKFGKMAGTKVILSLRGGALIDDSELNVFWRAFAYIATRSPDAFLCQGERWVSFLTNTLSVSSTKCHVVENWTATPALIEIGKWRDYSASRKLRMIFVGWLDRAKGVFDLVAAVQAMVQQGLNIELHFAGEGDSSDELRKIVVRQKLEKHIYFCGWISGKEKIAFFRAADIFCLPSHAEGLPNAMIEAMAAGIPVVITGVGAIPDVITHNVNGLLIPVRDSVALTQTLTNVVSDVQLQKRLGTAAHATAQKRFLAESAVDKITALIENLVRQ